MPTTRRSGASNPSSLNSTASARTSASASFTADAHPPPAMRTPPPPVFLFLYPLTLLLGSLFSLLDPSARAAPYSAVAQSHPPDVAPSYFAQKKNIFNVYFVKIGWFWITLSYLSFLATRSLRPITYRNPNGAVVVSASASFQRLQGLVRWALATAWWVAITQWFFGPALIDRGFRFTGGKCNVLMNEGADGMADLISASTCRLAGGTWSGGHDISGHVFLLVLGSAFLGLEVLPGILQRRDASGQASEKEEEEEEEAGLGGDEGRGWAVWFVGAVGALSWWMLLMTAAYFHTWFEKLTGLLAAFTALASVYLLPQIVPEVRLILGMPSA